MAANVTIRYMIDFHFTVEQEVNYRRTKTCLLIENMLLRREIHLITIHHNDHPKLSP